MIPFVLFLCVIAWSVYSLQRGLEREHLRIEESMHERLSSEMNGLQRELERQLAQGDAIGAIASAQSKIDQLSVDRHLTVGFLADEGNNILIAVSKVTVGLPVKQVFPTLTPHPELMPSTRQDLVETVRFAEDRYSVMGFYPILLEGVIDENPSAIGVLFMEYDLAEFKLDAAKRMKRETLLWGALLVGLSLLVGLFFHFALTRRVARLISATERLAAGDLSAEATLQGGDELSRIGAAFNRVASQIKADRFQFRRKARLLKYQALHDGLTDLPNRTLFNERLEQAVLGSARQVMPFAVLMMDLDGFKEVNDNLGHHIGDLLLQRFAGRLRHLLRGSDTVARLGGDEFAVLITDVVDARRAALLAQKVVDSLKQTSLLREHKLHIGVSIGISLFPDHGHTSELLLRCADTAMYVAKRGGGGFSIYNPSQEQNLAV